MRRCPFWDTVRCSATAENPTISLAIDEGRLGSELLTALRSQLVDQYMRDLNIHRGVYLVAWPDRESWTSDHADNRIVGRRSRE